MDIFLDQYIPICFILVLIFFKILKNFIGVQLIYNMVFVSDI